MTDDRVAYMDSFGPPHKRPRIRDRALTLLLMGWRFSALDRYWEVVEVATNGDVLAFADAPRWDYPGVAYHRWFMPFEMDAAVEARMEYLYERL